MRLIHAFEGRDLLLRLGYISQFHDAARRKPIPDQLRATYKVAPIPRNMDLRLHQGRREARVEALEQTYAHKNTTYYVDAANYDHANNKAVATVVDHTLTEHALPSRAAALGDPPTPAIMIKVLILLAMLALFAVSQTVAAPQYYVADGLYYGYPYAAYYGAHYPYYYYGR
ncbi:hypothetical protein MRX96_023946 [Rhipicephalus microplus]